MLRSSIFRGGGGGGGSSSGAAASYESESSFSSTTNDLGMEMEQLQPLSAGAGVAAAPSSADSTPSSPSSVSGFVQRTASGSLLFSRSSSSSAAAGNNRTTNSFFSPISSNNNIGGGLQRHNNNNNRSSVLFEKSKERGSRFARLAWQMLAGRVLQIRTRTSANTPRRRIYWLLCLLGLIGTSIFWNVFEGSYMISIFGDGTTRSEQDQSSFDPPLPPVVGSNGGGATIGGGSNPTSYGGPPPTAAPTLPIISAEEHVQNIQNAMRNSNTTTTTTNTATTTTTSIDTMMNSFTTWLDFGKDDPPKRKKYPPPAADGGAAFATQWCDCTGTSWYPKRPKDMWQKRAPQFLLPGAAFSGTVYLAAVLHRHPQIVPARTKELQFFHERPFRKFVSSSNEKTLVKAARNKIYAQDYDISMLKNDENKISFDASPGYLFYSSLLPRRILCVEPWIQLVLLLRNPVDRVLEQYAAAQDRGLKLRLDDWLDRELMAMNSTGLLNATANSKEEDLAWYEYQLQTGPHNALGRSLYVIQIRHWVQAFRTAGKVPRDNMLIVRTDHLALDTEGQFHRVLDFLNLTTTIPLPAKLKVPPLTITHQTRAVTARTRKRLEDFFRPYNRRLKRLLRQYGMDE